MVIRPRSSGCWRWQEAREPLVALERIGWEPIPVRGTQGTIAAHTGDRDEAERIFRRLPASEAPYSEAIRLYWRASIAANLGEKDRAVTLLREAFARGLPYSTVLKPADDDGEWPLHSDVDLEPLWHYPPFEELIKPKG